MKRQMTLQVPGAGEPNDDCPTDMSVEAALQRELIELGEWLSAQGFDPRGGSVNANAGSRDQLYCHYGYFIGMRHALAMLTTRGATVH